MNPVLSDSEIREIATPSGPARAHLDLNPTGRGLLVLGHGAGGGVDAADLRLAGVAAIRLGMSLARVEQPYRVAGRKAPAPAAVADAAWTAVVAELVPLAAGPLITGGRSYGARVACRTAAATGSSGVLCLAFPVQPARAGAPSRQPELDGVGVPTLVIQGDRDPFGMPIGSPTTEIAVVSGDHSLRRDHPQIEAIVERWLTDRLAGG